MLSHRVFFVIFMHATLVLGRVAESEDDPGQRYLRAAARPGVSAFEKKAYEQLALLHRGTFAMFMWRLKLTPNHGPPKDAMGVLYGMGIDVLPVLSEALDDRTPSQTFIYDWRMIFNSKETWPVSPATLREARVGQWKVNELVGALICTIAERNFAVTQRGSSVNIQDIGQKPALVPQFKHLVLDWYRENVGRTPLERNIADLNSDIPANRWAAIAGIGMRKEGGAQAAVVKHLENILAHGMTDRWSVRELSQGVLTLGQLGDSSSAALVHRICKELARFAETTKFSVSYDRGHTCSDLFTAYRGLALLGKKREALKELDELHKRSSGQWRPNVEEEYQTNLAKAGRW